MAKGSLSDHFTGVGAKVLKGTEIDPNVSNGHELQGISDFRAFLGSPSEKTSVPVSYIWLSDENPPLKLDLTGTWYNSRKNQPHREAEYRLYYPKAAEEIVTQAKTGDTLFFAKPKEGALLAIFCKRGSSIEQQLLWLFGLQLSLDNKISQNDLREDQGKTLDLTARYILELIGIEVLPVEDVWLEKLEKKFGLNFPGTKEFSQYARSITVDVDPLADPDHALVQWMDNEELLFMTLERHIVGLRLQNGFVDSGKADVDDFIKFSLSVHNRRKARAGWAFGNHIEEIIKFNGIKYKREATTEKRNGPDFLFPGEQAYHSNEWPATNLTMLAAKTSCKDRWRQVLAEADRIQIKHLLTLEPGISETQTGEMNRAGLQLVLPKQLHETYKTSQRPFLIDVESLIELIKERQIS